MATSCSHCMLLVGMEGMKAIELSCKERPKLLGLLFGRFQGTVVVGVSVTWQQIAVEQCFEGYKTLAETLKLELDNYSRVE